MNQIYVKAKLQFGEKQFSIATTHLKAKPKFEDIRHVQAKQLVNALTEGQNHIVCGDFNDVPDSKPLREMCTQYESASVKFAGKEPEFTTYKYRESEGMKKRVIDFVLVKAGVKVVGQLDMPVQEDIDSHMGNPCKNHPSDHYSLCFELDLS